MSAPAVDLSSAVTPGIRIADIRIGERARVEYGDLEPLKKSIREHGLLQPIVLLPDNYLLCGGRRLEACKQLGWDSIPATWTADQGDAISRLKAERDENTCRKDMTASELVAIGKKLEEMERPKAEERQRSQAFGRGVDNSGSLDPELSRNDHPTRTAVADALGMSPASYARAKRVVETAADEGEDPEVRKVAAAAQALMDAGKLSIRAANERVRDAIAEATAATGAADSKRLPIEERLSQISDLAPRGFTSAQIAAELGLSEGYVREKARENGVEIIADKVMARTHRQRIDSNHIVQETVSTLEGLASSVRLVNVADLDLSLTQDWAASLTESIRELNRLNRTIKEMAQ